MCAYTYNDICILYLCTVEKVWVSCIWELQHSSVCSVLWLNHSKPLISIILLAAANKDTNESLDFINQSSHTVGWQSGLSAQPGPGAQRPAEEPICTKPFRAPAIRLRLLFFLQHCWCWDKCSSGLLRSTLKAIFHLTTNSHFRIDHFGFLHTFLGAKHDYVRTSTAIKTFYNDAGLKWLSRCWRSEW